jgi:hypothetical protein
MKRYADFTRCHTRHLPRPLRVLVVDIMIMQEEELAGQMEILDKPR